ncbi:MAG: Asp23/Gls24 family envelope stress response protein [Clostridia bacterium]|nr:Asp23/Gls24 family envelope stress response protein [Clostridia bacterium]
MGKELSTGLGQITMSDDAIAALAGMAATECYGLVGMASRTFTDGIAELLGRENISRGVEVHVEGDDVWVHLYIIVEYGTRITVVAGNVMDKVKYVLETSTGLHVAGVNITVQGVRVGADGKERRK